MNNQDDDKNTEGGFFAGLSRNLTRIAGSFSRASISALSKPLAGTISGIAEESAGYPLDLVKTRLQLATTTGISKTGIIKIFKDVIKEEGAIGLFKGLSSPLLSSAFITALQFGIFDNSLKYFRANHYFQDHDTINLLLAGSMAGFVQSFITCPVDLIKIQLQIQGFNNNGDTSNTTSTNENKLKSKGNLYYAKQIYNKRGLLGFYQGLSPTLFRDVPGLAIFFCTYETFKNKFSIDHVSEKGIVDNDISVKSNPKSFLKTIIPIVLSGGFAGVFYHGLTHPFDIAKTLIQSDKTAKKYKGTFDCIKHIYKNGGGGGSANSDNNSNNYNKGSFKNLFKGFSAVAIKSFQSNAVGFLVYEIVINL